ncbi:hypothetical protein G4B88_024797 [Cannabis sativa]|uniref:Uncharacterized protein n=1 Tax=Cannabis sativa TaxID=3483 RepID=A0A7J6DKM3_CANSA|nr:hypothetical protein G4B88_024797 [Cannabis sativa]
MVVTVWKKINEAIWRGIIIKTVEKAYKLLYSSISSIKIEVDTFYPSHSSIVLSFKPYSIKQRRSLASITIWVSPFLAKKTSDQESPPEPLISVVIAVMRYRSSLQVTVQEVESESGGSYREGKIAGGFLAKDAEREQ